MGEQPKPGTGESPDELEPFTSLSSLLAQVRSTTGSTPTRHWWPLLLDEVSEDDQAWNLPADTYLWLAVTSKGTIFDVCGEDYGWERYYEPTTGEHWWSAPGGLMHFYEKDGVHVQYDSEEDAFIVEPLAGF